jgi:hypothetical protein
MPVIGARPGLATGRQHKRGRAALGGAAVAEWACGRWSIRPRKEASGRWPETRLSPKAAIFAPSITTSTPLPEAGDPAKPRGLISGDGPI